MDIPPEVATIAVQAGGAIVTAMLTSGWNAAKEKIARSVTGGNEDEKSRMAARLDRDREKLVSADPGVRSSLEPIIAERWSDFVIDAAHRDPCRVEALVAALGEVVKDFGGQQTVRPVTQIARADGFASRVNQVGGSQYNFGSSPD